MRKRAAWKGNGLASVEAGTLPIPPADQSPPLSRPGGARLDFDMRSGVKPRFLPMPPPLSWPHVALQVKGKNNDGPGFKTKTEQNKKPTRILSSSDIFLRSVRSKNKNQENQVCKGGVGARSQSCTSSLPLPHRSRAPASLLPPAQPNTICKPLA